MMHRIAGRTLKKLPWAVMILGSIAIPPGHSWGQAAGDRVVVTATSPTKIGEQPVGEVQLGEIFTVLAVENRWVALEGVRGWVSSSHLMSLTSARRFFEQRIRANLKDYEAIACLGMIQYEQGDLAAAFAQLNDALKLNGQNPAIWNWRGIILNAEHKYSAALADFNEALRLKPDFALALHNRGLTYLETGEFQRAIEDFDQAIETQANRPEFFVHRGAAWHSHGDDAKALADYDQALKLSQRVADAYLGKGNVYLGREDFESALQQVQSALTVEPDSAKALNLRGWIAYRRQDHKAARQDFDRAIRLAPDFPVPFNNRGVLAIDQGRYRDALQDLNQAIRLAPGISIYYTNRGNAHNGLGDYPAALADYQKGVELSPQLPDAINGLAWFLATTSAAELRKPDRAAELIAPLAAKSDEVESGWLDTYAAALAAQGNFPNAIEIQSQAVDKAPSAKKATFQNRLDLYRAGKVFVEPPANR